MKDETIRPGDLVMVVKPMPCCGGTNGLGKIYTASFFATPNSSYVRCNGCGNLAPLTEDYIGLGGRRATFKSRLKKIHPPELPETVDERQEVEA